MPKVTKNTVRADIQEGITEKGQELKEQGLSGSRDKKEVKAETEKIAAPKMQAADALAGQGSGPQVASVEPTKFTAKQVDPGIDVTREATDLSVKIPEHRQKTNHAIRDRYLQQVRLQYGDAFVKELNLDDPNQSYEEVKESIELFQKDQRSAPMKAAYQNMVNQRLLMVSQKFSDPTYKPNNTDLYEMFLLSDFQQGVSEAGTEEAQAAAKARLRDGLELLEKYRREPELYQEPTDVVQNQKLIFAASQLAAPIIGLAAGDAGTFMEAAATGSKGGAEAIAKTDKEIKERNFAYRKLYQSAVSADNREVAGLVKTWMNNATDIDKKRMDKMHELFALRETERHNMASEGLTSERNDVERQYKEGLITDKKYTSEVTRIKNERDIEAKNYDRIISAQKGRSTEKIADARFKQMAYNNAWKDYQQSLKSEGMKSMKYLPMLAPEASITLRQAAVLRSKNPGTYRVAVQEAAPFLTSARKIAFDEKIELGNIDTEEDRRYLRRAGETLKAFYDLATRNGKAVILPDGASIKDVIALVGKNIESKTTRTEKTVWDDGWMDEVTKTTVDVDKKIGEKDFFNVLFEGTGVQIKKLPTERSKIAYAENVARLLENVAARNAEYNEGVFRYKEQAAKGGKEQEFAISEIKDVNAYLRRIKLTDAKSTTRNKAKQAHKEYWTTKGGMTKDDYEELNP